RLPPILQTSLTLKLPCFSIVFSRLSAAPARAPRRFGRLQTGEGVMLESSAASRPPNHGSSADDLRAGGFDPPLDLVHLARQWLGDHELEAELLGLFRLQAPALTAQLADPSLVSLESKANIAHKLRGSALSVGAGRVARAALCIEELASAP